MDSLELMVGKRDRDERRQIGFMEELLPDRQTCDGWSLSGLRVAQPRQPLHPGLRSTVGRRFKERVSGTLPGIQRPIVQLCTD
jgi:hypothetical protein